MHASPHRRHARCKPASAAAKTRNGGKLCVSPRRRQQRTSRPAGGQTWTLWRNPDQVGGHLTRTGSRRARAGRPQRALRHSAQPCVACGRRTSTRAATQGSHALEKYDGAEHPHTVDKSSAADRTTGGGQRSGAWHGTPPQAITLDGGAQQDADNKPTGTAPPTTPLVLARQSGSGA